MKIIEKVPFCLLLCTVGCGASAGQNSGGTPAPTAPYDCPAAFSACGGSLLGTWRWAESCVAFDRSCFDVTVVDREARTSAFLADGTFSGTAGEDAVTGKITASCYAPGGPNSEKSCAGSASDVCAFDAGGNCVCTGGATYPASVDSYTSTPSTFTLNFHDGTPSRTFDYCVQAGTLTTRSKAGHILFYAAL